MLALLKFLAVSALIATGAVAVIILILIILNGRDPYGGPIEPAAPH
jgi:hypothetical protein